jgi:dihydrofolate synthase/folylpolyglutamate synthase
MNYDHSVRSLLALGRELGSPQHARVQKFGLENIRILSSELGNPQLAAACAHIAGTNGKGSTAAMLESVLRAAGFDTGLYTSPHLERINERIRINGRQISDEAFAAAWTRVNQTIESLIASGKLAAHPTFFECVTAIAFVAFAEAAGHSGQFISVYEVGLGGRLDSTNIVEPGVTVITPIDFDHENFLGHSIEQISSEKAGIIKPGVAVATASQRPEARRVIERRAEELGARVYEAERLWRVDEITSQDGFYRTTASLTNQDIGTGSTVSIAPSLAGRFQVSNALVAATAAVLFREQGYAISDEAITRGLASAHWPGRLERLSERPALYLDGAHNPAAARELKKFWEESFPARRIVLIYGAMRDKAVDEIAGLLFPVAECVILTQPNQSRAISAPLLAEMTSGLARKAITIADPGEALEQAISTAAKDDVIFVTGSLFLVGDLRRYWHNRTAKTHA